MIEQGFESASLRMQPMLLVSLQAPIEDVDRILNAVVRIASLGMGKYDSNAFQSGPGVASYQEPVVRVHSILSSRTKGIDDSQNPNRWWNTHGDWKQNAPPSNHQTPPP